MTRETETERERETEKQIKKHILQASSLAFLRNWFLFYQHFVSAVHYTYADPELQINVESNEKICPPSLLIIMKELDVRSSKTREDLCYQPITCHQSVNHGHTTNSLPLKRKPPRHIQSATISQSVVIQGVIHSDSANHLSLIHI